MTWPTLGRSGPFVTDGASWLVPLWRAADRLRHQVRASLRVGPGLGTSTVIRRPGLHRSPPVHLAPTPSASAARAQTAGSVLLLVLACASGAVFLQRGTLPMPTDTGLVTVLPWSFWLTVALLLAGTTLAIWGPRLSAGLAAANTAVLVIALYGVGVVFSPFPRGTVPWRHVGIANELATTRVVDTSIDAYFGWPGFFALLASYTGLAGLDDGQALMKWAPVAVQLLLLAPLLVVLRALTSDERLVWSAITLYYLTNWVDQDYLAPQAMGFFLYLCVLGLLLTFFRPPETRPPRYRPRRWAPVSRIILRGLRGSGPERDPYGPGPAPATGQVQVLLLIVLLTAAVVSAHQLTPFALLLAFLGLAHARRTPIRGLPIMAGVLIVAWLTYSAAAYMQGNLGQLLQGVGDVAGAAQAGITERSQGSPGHLQVISGRVWFSLVVWGLAGLAVVSSYASGRRDSTAVVLMATPGLLFAMQSYGGEMLLRIFMFTLPFACFLVVQLLPKSRTSDGRRRAGGLFLLAVLLLAPAFVLVRYGNQLIDQRSAAEVAAVEELYRLAPPGSLLVAGNDNTPWRYTEYGQHRHVTLERLLEDYAPADATAVERALHDRIATHDEGAFVLLTRQQEQYDRLLGHRTPYTVDEVEQVLVGSPRFEVVHRSSDAVVLTAVRKP